MRIVFRCFTGAAIALMALPASAAVIQVSPADGPTAYTKIEGAGPGDEVVIAPGNYAFRVYLQAKAPASKPIYIHAADPARPPVWDLGSTLVEAAPGSYTAPDKNRGCWQVSGGANYVIEGITFQNCHSAGYDAAGLRYYNGTTGLVIKNCLFQGNDNGLTGGTEDSDVTVSFSEFSGNGNTKASSSSPTHNVYIYGGTFALRYSYLHDPTQGQNLHCRAVTSTIEYNWFDRAKSYVGDLMTSDDYANAPNGSLAQSMTLRGNVIIQDPAQANSSQIWAVLNDEASGAPVTFSITALSNTVVGAGGHAAFIHLANADGTRMSAAVSNNIIAGTSQPILVDSAADATVSGSHDWIETGADATGLSGAIVGASPGFAAAASEDFTLASGSPCIAAADSAIPGPPTDEYYENEKVTRMYRVRETAGDLGAFEHTTQGPGIGPDGPSTVPPDGGASGTGSTTGTGGGPATTTSTGAAASATTGTGGGPPTTTSTGAAASATTGTGGGPPTTTSAGAGGASSSTGTGVGAGTGRGEPIAPSSSGGCACHAASSPADSGFGPLPLWLALALYTRLRRGRRSAVSLAADGPPTSCTSFAGTVSRGSGAETPRPG